MAGQIGEARGRGTARTAASGKRRRGVSWHGSGLLYNLKTGPPGCLDREAYVGPDTAGGFRGTFLCWSHTRLLLLKFLGRSSLPFPPPLDCPSALLASSTSPDTLLSAADVHCLAHAAPVPILQACLQLLAAVQCPVRGTGEAPSNLFCPLHGAIPHLSRLRWRIASTWKPSLPAHAHCPQMSCPGRLGASGRTGHSHSLAQSRLLGSVS